ncbi:protein TIFY 10a-like [Andrographis paniculata]|uniref:protein TIFY 10a-like n=1 Tax=Andrographis paniculata TaxID=175694 RepID=UPI0021E8B820|nr:protein TIFY 10a-like [Andrographis paniculata]
MDSTGKAFSGRRSNNFSQTCSLLSQYLKERGSFGDVTLGLNPSLATDERRETMELLPKLEKSNRTGAGELSGSAEIGQMIIFYGGQVMVYDEFPAEKVEEVMILARNSSAAFAPPSPAESATSTPRLHHSDILASDLPITRKRSLARFLEKRKDRIAANAPYEASKPARREPWLGLAPELPVQRRRL